MQIEKKYKKLLQFINIFDEFKDADELVDLTDAEYNKIKVFMHRLESIKTEDNTNEKIKVISEDDFDASSFGVDNGVFDFGWYENGTTKLGIPTNKKSFTNLIMFNDFYWKNNYESNQQALNSINYVQYEQWTTRGIGFNNLIIDSNVVVYFGMHNWSNGNWDKTILYVNDNLVDDYIALYTEKSQMPDAIKPISEYNTNNTNKADWWKTY